MEYKYELVQADNHFPLKIIVHFSNEPVYIPGHWHDSIEISYVLSVGVDDIYIDGTNYSSKEGDIVLINSNAIHSFSVAKGKGREAVTVLIPSIRSFNSNKYLERLTLITDYIQENYDQSLSLDSIAQIFGLSPEYLSRFFVKHVGMTLFQYINAIRLERSFRVLMNTDHSIPQIALEHGFPNEKSFARVFKKVYQATPHQY
ncbi:helix-turn-helix transcriptional regulator [Paenibacillus brasilensis]|uniref:AraC-like DNA-binding protein n=1 Tax=Paenibacillus brasilensis TaxID=128574 RepID=A0ABU0KWQ2_9BACL|nr:AraC family transcriptional regulator [Paenibacillus brasilensis]MDQ0492821.1 AraC-like DNA-binding protein [Paenibacillus brasilensis]